MSDLVLTRREGDILVVLVNNPPVNALSPGVPEAIVAAVRAGAADPATRAIVVAGEGRTFIAGFDIKEFEKITSGERKSIDLAEQILEIENCSKPVVMALHGTALGGGLEVAMGGHYRVAAASAQVGQPEVKLGLMPGAGGTQRLPRLCGLRMAMEMSALGEPVGAQAAFEGGIIDRIIEGDLIAGAVEFARSVNGPRRTRDRNEKLAADAGLVEEIKARAAKQFRGQTAPVAAIDAVAATAVLPFAEGIKFERRLFEELLYGEQSKALIHVFFGERTVTKIPGLAKDTPVLPVKSAAVVGAGTMGSGIAMAFANAGIPVRLTDAQPESLERGMAAIRARFEKTGKPERAALITPVHGYDGFESADVIVEAVFENLELKKQVFAELDVVARPGAILATNTSTLDIDAIAAMTKRPEWVAGLHFFSPAHIMRLLEIVRGRATSDTVLATAIELGKRLRKVPVVAGNCFGFIGNRMFGPYRKAAIEMVEAGAGIEQVDAALREFGMAMGPLQVGDLAGLDVSALVRKAAGEAGGVEQLLYERGRFGQKTGKGWYRYEEDRRPLSDPEVESIIRKYALDNAIPQRKFTSQEIVDGCIGALAAEGRRILDEGIALRPVDIDVVYVCGYGFPAWRGGPMYFTGIK
jgi:3-hydroxyacyl-CoA dehydrogenase